MCDCPCCVLCCVISVNVIIRSMIRHRVLKNFGKLLWRIKSFLTFLKKLLKKYKTMWLKSEVITIFYTVLHSYIF